MNYITLFTVVVLFSAISVTQAQARKARLFAIPGFSSGETIDLVYDLPNTATFLRDGKAYDLGYLNSSKGNAYVLYHGDRYSKLSDADIARLKATLGFDPTAKHRIERTALDAESGRWNSVIIVLMWAGGIFVLFRVGLLLIRSVIRSLTSPAGAEKDSEDAVDTPLEIRKKQMMNRHWSDNDADHGARTVAPAAVSISPRAGNAVKAFGRRSA
ncbi:hypothetical protein CFBP6625_09810 [Agrobacterium tumefaciens]|nr:hypothetical protein CFBP6625_09810 [Agrobacterium tumefaciens]